MLELDDIKKRLFMMPRCIMEAIIILNQSYSKPAIDSVKRCIGMLAENIDELERALEGKEKNK